MKIYTTLLTNNIDNLQLAYRAAKWLMDTRNEQKDAILAYGNDVHFFVKRVKSGISVREIV